jgi:hypothetical protein
MKLRNQIVSDVFLQDVRQYVLFLNEWFSAERWLSSAPSVPHRSGVPTSAEIAYILLRFGRFQSNNWEEWRMKGFVALDNAIENAVRQTRRLLVERNELLASPARLQGAAEIYAGIHRVVSILPGDDSDDASLFMIDPLLRAVAVHVYDNCSKGAIQAPFATNKSAVSSIAGR